MADHRDERLRSQLREEVARNNKLQNEVLVLTREKTRLAAESEALNSTKLKLEELCRVLQARNKELIAQDTSKRDETQAAVARTVADVQAKLEAYSEDQKAVIAENAVLRKLLTDAQITEKFRDSESAALSHQAKVALQLSELREQQVKELSAVHAADLAEHERVLAKAKEAESAAVALAASHQSKFAEYAALMTKELEAFKTFKKNVTRQMDRLSAAATSAEKERGSALARAITAETALLQNIESSREKDARTANQIAVLSKLAKGLAAERTAAHEALAKALAVTSTWLHPEAEVASLPARDVADLVAILTVGVNVSVSSSGPAPSEIAALSVDDARSVSSASAFSPPLSEHLVCDTMESDSSAVVCGASVAAPLKFVSAARAAAASLDVWGDGVQEAGSQRFATSVATGSESAEVTAASFGDGSKRLVA